MDDALACYAYLDFTIAFWRGGSTVPEDIPELS